jgi:hypothetical protein
MLSARNSGGIGDSARRRRRVRRAEKGAMLSSEVLEPKVLLTVVSDSFEPNDSLAAAHDFSTVAGRLDLSNLSIHTSSDRDFFRFVTTGAGTADHYVDVQFTHTSGDVDARLLNSAGSTVAFSTGVSNTERFNLQGLAAGAYYVEVYGFAGSVNNYSLAFNTPAVQTADSFEANNTQGTASNLGTISGTYGLQDLTIHTNTDRDFYAFTTTGIGTADHYVGINFTHSFGDIDARLLNSAGVVVAGSGGVGNSERLNLQGLAAGTYFVEVYGFGGARNLYNLNFTTPAGQAADRFEANNTRETATNLGTVSGAFDWEELSIHTNTDRDFYQFATSGVGTSDNFIEVNFTHSFGDIDVRLLNSAGAVVSSSTGVGNSERLSLQGLPVGTYFVEVYGFAGSRNNYSLRFDTPVAELTDRFEVNNTRETATDLRAISGLLDVEDLSIHSITDRDFFRFDTTGIGTADNYVDVLFSHVGGDVDTRLLNSAGAVIASSTGVFDNERLSLQGLAAGTYFLEVYGFGGALNDYELSFNTPATETADRFEVNNTRETATDLRAVSGFFEWEDLSIHSASDRDFFRFVTSGVGTADNYVDVLFSHASGDVDARLLNSAGVVIASSTGVSDNERLSLQGLAAGTYFVEIYGFAGALNNYGLTFDTPAAETADRFEVNNTRETATDLRTVSGFFEWEDLSIHSASDRDFFRFVTSGVGTADNYIDVLFSHASGDVDARLLNSAGVVIASSTGVSDNERLSLQGLAAGTYFLEVYGFAGALNNYGLTFDTPAAEVADRFEVNNTRETATDLRTVSGLLEWEDLSIHSTTDRDFFRFETTGAGAADNYVDVLFSHASGDVDVRLLNSAGAVIASSTGVGDNERLSLQGLAAGTYFVEVYGFAGALNDYGLTFNTPAAEVTDRFEVNNNVATATDLRTITGLLDVEDLSIHSNTDRDFFRFVTTGAGTADNYVDVLFSHASGDVDVRLLNSAGAVIASSTGVGDSESLSLQGLAAGTYFVEVYGFAGALNNYSLSFNAPAAEVTDRFEVNNTRQTATDLRTITGLLDVEDLSIHSTTDRDFFRFVTTGAGTADNYVDVLFSHASGDVDVRLLNSAGAVIASSTGVGDSESLSLQGLAAGTYFVEVYGFAGALNNYSLSFNTPAAEATDRFEVNNTRQTATDLRTITGLLDVEDLSIHSNTDRDFFRFATTGAGTADNYVDVLFSHASGDVDVRLLNSAGAVIASSTGVTDSERLSLQGLAAGTYFVEVYGFAGALNNYSLSFNTPAAEATDRFEVNNTRQTATDLRTITGLLDVEDLSIHSTTDRDFFRFATTGAGTADNYVDVLFSHASGDVDVRLLNSAGAVIASSTGVTDSERLSLQGLAAGTYFVEVYGFAGALNNYSLSFNTPAAEVTDRFEVNNNVATATDLRTITGLLDVEDLSIHSTTDRDFFRFVTTGLGTVDNYVDVLFPHASGDVDVRLLNSAGVFVTGSFGVSDDERVSLQGLAAGTYYIEVYGFAGALNNYSLSFNTPAAETTDRYEVNNSVATATDLRTVSGLWDVEELSIHSTSDRDFFRFVTTGAGTADNYVDVLFSHAGGDVDARILNSAGVAVTGSFGVSDNERLSLQGLAAGTYFVEVYGFAGALNTYSLSFNTPAAEATDRFEVNNTRETATDLRTISGLLDVEDLSIHSTSDRDFFRFTTSGAGTSENYVDVLFSHTSGDVDARILNSAGVAVTGSFGVSDNERLSLEGLAAGTYFVEVYGFAGALNNYGLSFNTPAAETTDRYEVNNTRETATDLRTIIGELEVEDLSIHSTTDRDFFEFVTTGEGTSENYVDVLFSHAGGDVDARLIDTEGRIIVSSTGVADNERLSLDGLVAGTYIIEVYGYAGARNNYSLSINAPAAEATDRYEVNNTLQTATDLRSISGELNVENLSIHSATDRDFFRFTTTGAGTADTYVDVLFAHDAGDIDVRLVNGLGTFIRQSIGTEDNERISLQGLTAGTYFIEVYGYSGALNDYSLSFNTPVAETLDRYEVNNTIATATDLRTLSGALTLDDLSVHNGADRDFYRFTIAAGATVANYAQVNFAHAAGDLNARIVNAAGSVIRSSVGLLDNERLSLAGLGAGTYFLEVFGASTSVTNNYSLSFDTPVGGAAEDAWTIMVYVTASDLESFAFADVNEMEQAVSRLPGTVNISVLWDQSSARTTYATGGGTQARWGTAGRAFVTPDTNRSVIGTRFELLNEVNTGNPQSLIDFVNWSVTTAPAERYGLVMWDHGAGLQGFNFDDSDSGQAADNLSTPELVQALTTLRGNNVNIDMVSFDACLMATTEVGYAVRGLTSTYVASQEVVAGDGHDYNTLFDVLESDPYSVSPQGLGTGFVRSFGEQYLGGGIEDTQSAIYASQYNSLATALRSFTTSASSATSADRTAMATARNATQTYTYSYLRDLGGFMQRIVNNTAITAGIRTAATGVLTAISNAVISKTADSRNSSGFSIYLPDLGTSIPSWYSSTYAAFDAATGWSGFISGAASAGRSNAPSWAGESGGVPSRAFDLGATAGNGLVFDELSLEGAADSDWFRFTIQQNGTAAHRILAQAMSSTVAMTARLYNAAGTTLLATSGTNGQISLNGRAAGEYSIRVSAAAAVDRYRLYIDAPLVSGSTRVANNTASKAISWGLISGERLETGIVTANTTGTPTDTTGYSYYEFDTAPSIVQQRFELAVRTPLGVSLQAEVLNSAGTVVVVSRIGTGLIPLVFNSRGAGETYKFRVRRTPSATATAAVSFSVQFSTVLNSAPRLTNTGSPRFDTVRANAPATEIRGNTVAELLARLAPGGAITDADPGALTGIAVNALSGTTSGRWEYTLNGGTTWVSIGVVNNTSALLLASNTLTRIRFVPNARFAGNVTLQFAAWDQSRGVSGGRFNIAQRGESTPFSLVDEVAGLTVNTAPVLNAAGAPAFDSVPAGATASVIRGNSVADLLARLSPSGSVTDADAGALRGIAVHYLPGTTSGVWQYSLNGGALWQNLGIVSTTSALLLAADTQTRIRFVPNAGFVGNVALGFVAWDRTLGVNGARSNVSARGGANAFSVAGETASLRVVSSSVQTAALRTAALDSLFSSDLAFVD